MTLNLAITLEDYPKPNIEEILYDFGCCRYYSKFDVREAYMHMPVTEETTKLLTVNTPRGLLKVNRMNYGVQSAPAKWQRMWKPFSNQLLAVDVSMAILKFYLKMLNFTLQV